MVTSTGSESPQPEDRAHPTPRSRTTPHRRAHCRERQGRPRDEAGFWAQLEEREFGRLALEADYLFDTSYLWAA